MKKYKILNIKYFCFLLCIFAICYWLLAITPLFTIPAEAQSKVESTNYKITLPNLNMGAGLPNSSSYNLGVTMGQTAPGLYTSTSYKVRAGFWYIKSIIPFSFSISDFSIEFGSLVPGTPSTLTNTLTVSAGGAGGYTVKASENKPLTSTSNNTIPDTTCDAGGCSQTTAGVWSQNTTYGFGFNMSGNDIPADFIDSTYFRQFADRNAGESAQTVMSSANVGRSRQATVTYKVNVSNIQAAGNYQNILMFVATPTY